MLQLCQELQKVRTKSSFVKNLTTMKNQITLYSNPKQGILPIFISDFLDICDPVLTFDRFMEGFDLAKYLIQLPV